MKSFRSMLASRALCRAVLLLSAGAASADIVVNEIHYDPPDKTRRHEFVELHNTGGTATSLAGWSFTGGITYEFPAAAIIEPGGFAVVAQDPDAFAEEFGFVPFGPWTGALKNSGEKLTLSNPGGDVVDEVSYGAGFPWPTAPDGNGPSMELLHPLLDNDLGGSWRAASASDAIPPAQTYIPLYDAQWRYRKGLSEPPAGWRQRDFVEDDSWNTGQSPIGYGDGDDNTVLGDMSQRYTSVYLRHEFTVPSDAVPSMLQLLLNLDDGAVVWINGVEVARINVPSGTLPYTGAASAAVEPALHPVLIRNTSMLSPGLNVIAIHALNQSLTSSDLTIDAELRTPAPDDIAAQPTPGRANSVQLASASAAPPQIRQVQHLPAQPAGGNPVTVTAKITDPDGVASVQLSYQVVSPGRYVRKIDALYQQGWIDLPMRDDGTGGDAAAGDAIFTAVIPAEVNVHRTLIRYRITALDSPGNSVRVPYADDESPNFAYFVYNGPPAWSGASRPGSTPVHEFPPSLMQSLPVYHLLANANDVSNSQWNSGYDGARMWGTFVYDGKVYDHIQFHNRGEASTYNTGKNKWRFHFNRSRDFQARDLWGRRYRSDWKVLNFDACASPWASVNRGMAGLDEAVSYRLYELAGVPSSKTHYVHFRVIDNAVESSTLNQYEGDLWGLYQAIEQPDGRFLDERGLPDGNVYKIENHFGDKKHQGASQPADTSDWNQFLNASERTQTEAWWRNNMDMERFYSFHAMNRVTGNVDLRHGSNHYFYHQPDGRWVILPWDLDMMFIAMTHWPGIVDQNRSLVLPALALEFRNRCREILDLMCSDAGESGGQIGQLIDEYADIVNPPGLELTWADLDEAMWNWNPRTRGSNTPDGNTNHKGNFYRTPYTDTRTGGTWVRRLASPDHEGFARFILDYCTDTDPDGFRAGDGDQRGYGYNYLELEAKDDRIPATPVITYSGPEGFPAGEIRFQCSPFSDPQGDATFAAMKWRLAEIYSPGISNYVSGEPRRYEIEAGWESPELSDFNDSITLPLTATRPGATYRARVRFKDNTGRWSHWSPPVQFTASASDPAPLASSIVITEIMYRPAPPTPQEARRGFAASDFEFVELQNIGTEEVNLAGLRFTRGVDYDFPLDFVLPPGDFAVVAANVTAFIARYGTSDFPVIGSFAPDKLDDQGETLRLSSATGAALREFVYDDLAPWPQGTPGRSIVLIRPERNPDPASPANWRSGAEVHGSPGQSDTVGFEQWKSAHAASSDDDDLDGDDLPVFLEYISGGNPSVADPWRFPDVVYEEQTRHVEVNLRRWLRAEASTLLIEASSDLATWSPAKPDNLIRGVAGEIESLRYLLPVGPGSEASFIRVKVFR